MVYETDASATVWRFNPRDAGIRSLSILTVKTGRGQNLMLELAVDCKLCRRYRIMTLAVSGGDKTCR
jgi:hypothetical protein